MSNWYYTKNGEAKGPVTFEALKRIQQAGGLSAPDAMVWEEGTADWVEPSSVEGLISTGGGGSIQNPYAAPTKSANLAPEPTAIGELPVIAPGSQTINIGSIVTKSWHTFKKYAGLLIGAGVLAMALQIALSIAAQVGIGIVTGIVGVTMENSGAPSAAGIGIAVVSMLVFLILQLCVQMFIMMGIVRLGLNALSDDNPSINDLFSQGGKLLRAIGAGLLLYLIMFISMIPGSIIFAILVGIGSEEPSLVGMFIGMLAIYLPIIMISIRLSLFIMCIVDQDCGAVESLKQSWAMTQNNFWVLIGLALVATLFNIAGMLALLVGLIVSIPLTYLMFLNAYRWLRHGFRSCDLT